MHESVAAQSALTVHGDSITFDFTGSDPQRAGNVNTVEAVTVSSVLFALRTVLPPECRRCCCSLLNHSPSRL